MLIAADGAEHEIESALNRAATLLNESTYYVWLPEVALARAGFAASRGNDAERIEHLREAQRQFSEFGASRRAADLEQLIASPIDG